MKNYFQAIYMYTHINEKFPIFSLFFFITSL